MELRHQLIIELGLDVALELVPAVLRAGHWEEHLAWEDAALVVIDVQRPGRDLALAAGAKPKVCRIFRRFHEQDELDTSTHSCAASAELRIRCPHRYRGSTG